MTIGAPHRTLVLQEPPGNTIMPSDDQSWLQGVGFQYRQHNMSDSVQLPTEQAILALASPPTFNMGNFRLLVLSAQLLSRTICFIAGPRDPEFDAETSVQLVRTINALLNVLEFEAQSSITNVGVPRSLLYRFGILTAHVSH